MGNLLWISGFSLPTSPGRTVVWEALGEAAQHVPHPTPSSLPEGAGGREILTTMLEGEPGTLESREELTLPGEVSGCWGE